MAAVNPRVNVVLERPLYQAVKRLAKNDHISLSLKVRDLVREALEAYEDAILARFAEKREKTFLRSKALTHKQVWAHLSR